MRRRAVERLLGPPGALGRGPEPVQSVRRHPHAERAAAEARQADRRRRPAAGEPRQAPASVLPGEGWRGRIVPDARRETHARAHRGGRRVRCWRDSHVRPIHRARAADRRTVLEQRATVGSDPRRPGACRSAVLEGLRSALPRHALRRRLVSRDRRPPLLDARGLATRFRPRAGHGTPVRVALR